MLPTKPHFFQPLLSGFKQGISIPVSFISEYLEGQEKFEKATLRGPGGGIWDVKMKGRRFEQGWQELERAHDLQVGDFLVFEHQGNMVFDFKVFDPSACEREYPVFHIKQEILTSEDRGEEERDQEPDKSSPGEVKKKKKVRSLSKGKDVAASDFRVNVTSYGIKSSRLLIPRKFSRANGLQGRRCEAILKGKEGRTWDVNLGFKESDGQVYIGEGLRSFYAAYKIKSGDSFVLELINNGIKPIFKIRELTKKKQVKVEREIKKKRIRIDADLELKKKQIKIKSNEKPAASFIVNVTAYTAKRPRIIVPKAFARSNGLENSNCKIVLMNEQGRAWNATLAQNNNKGTINITQGWSAFRFANKIKAGASFMFELIEKGEKPVLQMKTVESKSLSVSAAKS